MNRSAVAACGDSSTHAAQADRKRSATRPRDGRRRASLRVAVGLHSLGCFDPWRLHPRRWCCWGGSRSTAQPQRASSEPARPPGRARLRLPRGRAPPHRHPRRARRRAVARTPARQLGGGAARRHERRAPLPRERRPRRRRLLVTERSGYRLRLPDDVVVDLDEAGEQLAAARELLSAGDAAQAATSAQRAAELAALPFLAHHDGTWVESVRDELEVIHTSALELQVHALADAGDPRAAAVVAERLVRAEPFSEVAHQLRISVLADADDRAGAIKAYEHCEAVLAAELGVKPSADTQALLRRVLERGSAKRPPARSEPEPAAAHAAARQRPPRRRARPPPARPYAAISVLVVEDHPFQRRTALALLRGLGVGTLAGAEDGNAALEWLAGSPPPDVIICDIDMPGMDGVEFIRRVAQRGLASAVAIASGLDRRLLNTIQSVSEGYGLQVLGAVEKPLTARRLAELLDAYRPPRAARGGRRSGAVRRRARRGARRRRHRRGLPAGRRSRQRRRQRRAARRALAPGPERRAGRAGRLRAPARGRGPDDGVRRPARRAAVRRARRARRRGPGDRHWVEHPRRRARRPDARRPPRRAGSRPRRRPAAHRLRDRRPRAAARCGAACARAPARDRLRAVPRRVRRRAGVGRAARAHPADGGADRPAARQRRVRRPRARRGAAGGRRPRARARPAGRRRRLHDRRGLRAAAAGRLRPRPGRLHRLADAGGAAGRVGGVVDAADGGGHRGEHAPADLDQAAADHPARAARRARRRAVVHHDAPARHRLAARRLREAALSVGAAGREPAQELRRPDEHGAPVRLDRAAALPALLRGAAGDPQRLLAAAAQLRRRVLGSRAGARQARRDVRPAAVADAAHDRRRLRAQRVRGAQRGAADVQRAGGDRERRHAARRRRIARGVDAGYARDVLPQSRRLVDASYLREKRRIMDAIERFTGLVNRARRARPTRSRPATSGCSGRRLRSSC